MTSHFIYSSQGGGCHRRGLGDLNTFKIQSLHSYSHFWAHMRFSECMASISRLGLKTLSTLPLTWWYHLIKMCHRYVCCRLYYFRDSFALSVTFLYAWPQCWVTIVSTIVGQWSEVFGTTSFSHAVMVFPKPIVKSGVFLHKLANGCQFYLRCEQVSPHLTITPTHCIITIRITVALLRFKDICRWKCSEWRRDVWRNTTLYRTLEVIPPD